MRTPLAPPAKEAKTIVPGIAQSLRTLIWSGQLHPGEHINQEVWAASLGVSHIPFREAVRILEGEGLLQVAANRGVSVTPVTPHEMEEWALEFKGLMHALLPLAVTRASPKGLARARSLIPQMDEASTVADAHLEFWRILFEPCGMPRLMSLLEQLIWRMGRYFLADGKAVFHLFKDVRPTREDFLDAFAAQDAPGAYLAIMTFLKVRADAFQNNRGL